MALSDRQLAILDTLRNCTYVAHADESCPDCDVLIIEFVHLIDEKENK